MLNLIFDFDGVIGDTYESDILARIKMNPGMSRQEAVDANGAYFSKKPNHTKNHNLSLEELDRSYKWVLEYGFLVEATNFDLFKNFVKEIELIGVANKAVVSSGSQQYVLPAVKKTNINPSHILAYEDHHSKEEKIELICKDWDVDVNEVYYFTDTLADVYELEDFIAKDKLIGVSWGFCTKEQLLMKLSVDQILNKPEDLSRLLL